MQSFRNFLPTSKIVFVLSCIWALSPALALESDRQQPLEVNADSTDGMLGDGVTTLSGHVEIKQGTLLIRADQAEVDTSDGKVRQITLSGNTAFLQQEIENQGLVKAWALTIEYKVGSGMVILAGTAHVEHPQYEVSGELLRYDLNLQHFEGNGSEDGNGRVHIRLDPELAPEAPDEPPENDQGKGL
ncbi:MAG: lipopolysaccharide export system protein LptA [Lysobacterales bacterium]|jgi:lipopolysaccharide export system protein LptA